MSGCHDCGPSHAAPGDPAYGRVLKIALGLNAIMFFLELAGSAHGRSVSLLSDSLDFFADAFNYGLTLWAIGQSRRHASWAALLKGVTFLAFGLFAIYRSVFGFLNGVVPHGEIITGLGVLALVVNVGVAVLLFRYRSGDANRQAAWICTRNDAIGNVAVMAAGLGVVFTRHGWPDWSVGSALALMALGGGFRVIRLALVELRGGPGSGSSDLK